MSERYEIELSPAARKQLLRLDRSTQVLIYGALVMLGQTPRPPAAKNLTGRPGQLRVRVMEFRIIYSVDDGKLLVLVIKIGHRRDVYK